MITETDLYTKYSWRVSKICNSGETRKHREKISGFVVVVGSQTTKTKTNHVRRPQQCFTWTKWIALGHFTFNTFSVFYHIWSYNSQSGTCKWFINQMILFITVMISIYQSTLTLPLRYIKLTKVIFLLLYLIIFISNIKFLELMILGLINMLLLIGQLLHVLDFKLGNVLPRWHLLTVLRFFSQETKRGLMKYCLSFVILVFSFYHFCI